MSYSPELPGVPACQSAGMPARTHIHLQNTHAQSLLTAELWAWSYPSGEVGVPRGKARNTSAQPGIRTSDCLANLCVRPAHAAFTVLYESPQLRENESI